MIRSCEYCGASFNVRPAVVARGQGRFCSKSCANAARTVYPKTAVCRHCGDTFTYNSSSSGRYCSQSCYHSAKAARWVERQCEMCGKTFSVRESSLQKGDTARYCSSQCKKRGYVGEATFPWKTDGGWPDGWNQIKIAVLERDSYTCQACGCREDPAGRALSVHHIAPRKEGDHSLDNLVTLCNRSHRLVHTGDLVCPPPSKDSLSRPTPEE
ncbi:MAG: HNH endonuclease [Armatimonadetes bacterium]|nr:HNH endonuclease [Armatimonadota bacterium]